MTTTRTSDFDADRGMGIDAADEGILTLQQRPLARLSAPASARAARAARPWRESTSARLGRLASTTAVLA